MFIKRVIGVPGDELMISGGMVYVNGTGLNEPYIAEPSTREYGPALVPTKRVFVLGDNRNNSQDSTDDSVGMVPFGSIQGKAFVVYWPVDRIRTLKNPTCLEAIGTPKSGMAAAPGMLDGNAHRRDGCSPGPALFYFGGIAMGFSWYPGHMAKAVSQIKQSMKLIDVVIEILDARAPRSTENREFAEAVGNKPRIVVLNKADLADPVATRAWVDCYTEAGICAVPTNCRTGEGVAEVIAAASAAAKAGAGPDVQRGPSRVRFRTAVLGIPNVGGKSSFINRAAKRARVKTGDRPGGVTRAKQWIVIDRNLEMLDTPGIMPPRVDDRGGVWFALAALGCLDESIYDVEALLRDL